jgi:HK97 family phage major capsid protein
MFQETPTAVTGAMSWENIVKMEEKADLQNALFGDLAYVMHPSLVAKAKTKVKDASGAGGFIFQGNGDGLLNGYKALRTNNMPKELQDGGDEFGIIFGNWADYFLGQWGSLELLVDPYTQSINGMVRLVFTGYFNMGMISPESFAIGSLK